MSAFLVQDSEINSVIAYLATLNRSHALQKMGLDLSKFDACSQLGARMFALNVVAIEERYGKGSGTDFRPLDYRFTWAKVPAAIQAYKTLQCFLYQCSEGDVPETELYQQMNALADEIAHGIVQALPSYERAVWG